MPYDTPPGYNISKFYILQTFRLHHQLHHTISPPGYTTNFTTPSRSAIIYVIPIHTQIRIPVTVITVHPILVIIIFDEALPFIII
jgi:hypothetical protein